MYHPASLVSSGRKYDRSGNTHENRVSDFLDRADLPAAEMSTFYTNETCRPTTDPSEPCTLGYYGVYAILAEKHDHVKAGVDFAREHNLRLVVRNTGHDFLGRSTGWGALVINTHRFKNMTFTSSYTGPGDYRGPAVTIGAGVQGAELLELANAQDPPASVVVGECAVRKHLEL